MRRLKRGGHGRAAVVVPNGTLFGDGLCARKYSKSAPLAYEDLAACRDWWHNRQADECAWKVSAAALVKRNYDGNVTACNLDIKNPHMGEVEDDREPMEIVDAIIERERAIMSLMDKIKVELAGHVR